MCYSAETIKGVLSEILTRNLGKLVVESSEGNTALTVMKRNALGQN